MLVDPALGISGRAPYGVKPHKESKNHSKLFCRLGEIIFPRDGSKNLCHFPSFSIGFNQIIVCL